MGCKVSYVPLGELAEFESGGTPSKKIESYWGGSIPWISAKTLVGDTVYESDLTISKEGLESGSKLASKGSLLLLTRGSGLFKRIPLAIAGIQVAYNQDIKCISANAKGISNRYLFYALKALEPAISAMLETTGIGAGKLATDRLKALPIPVLAEDARAKVTSFADCIYGKISLNAKLNGYLEELVSLMFDHLIGSCTETVPFSTYATISSGKRPPIKSPNYTDECVFPLFGATTQMGYTSEYLTDEKLLVIGRVGTHGVVQRVSGKAWPSDNTLVIRSEHYETASQLLQRVDYSSLNRGSTQPLITQGDLKAYEVPFINTASLERFENKSSQLMALYDHNSSESAKLTKLRDTLLPRLMSGEIDVSGVAF